MITQEDQLVLFGEISKELDKDIECWAFGGTAMLFYGYKTETKDIDLLFTKEGSRNEFLRATKNMGFKETSPFKIYSDEKLKRPNTPIMIKLRDVRIDIFLGKIFKTTLSDKMKEDKYAVHEFRNDKTLKLNVLRTEHIVLLKGVTERDRDFEDIKTILNLDKDFNWQYFIDEIIWQYNNGNEWILLDTEKVMRELKKDIFIEEKYFKQLCEINKQSD